MSVGAVNKQTGDRIPTAGMPAIDNALDLTSVNPVQNAVITAALAGKTDTGIVADDFDSTASYVIGNYCIKDGKLYRFKANHSGAWSASDVDEIQITGELATLKSGLNDVNSKLSPTSLTSTLASGFTLASWGSVRAYKVGNLAIISVSGLKAGSAITTETLAITIDGITFVSAMRGTVSPEGIVAVGDNGSVYIDGVTADTNLFFEIVGVLS